MVLSEKNSAMIGLKMTKYVNEIMDSTKEMTENQKNAKIERIYAKAKSGKKLTPEEKAFLQKYSPQLYAQVMRAEAARKALENRLSACKTKEEAYAAYSTAVSSISDKDPDREMLLNTINDVWREFHEKKHWKEAEGTKQQYRVSVSETGYQQLYVEEGNESFGKEV